MTELEIITQQLLDEVAKILPRVVPFEYALWSTKEIGEYLQRPVQVVRDRVVCLPGFPQAIRLPTVDGTGRAHPRWKAIEVVKWVESHQGGKRGRPRKFD
jgi:hypothetical protein